MASFRLLTQLLWHWGIPPGFQEMLKEVGLQRRSAIARAVLKKNEVFRNCYSGNQRCFILGTGPSIKQQDLKLLKEETCFAVSNFFVHRDYNLIQPRYHCVPKLCIPPYTEEDAVRWLQEIEAGTGQATLFLAYGDKELIERKGLFKNRQVHYLYFGKNWNQIGRTGIDLTRPLPSPQSVSVMALEIAIFMGFRHIYLLGCDHDWILHYGVTNHFYEISEHVVLSRPGFSEWHNLEEEFQNSHILWGQYRKLKEFSASRGVTIYNATAGGLLDVFERVNYHSLFKG